MKRRKRSIQGILRLMGGLGGRRAARKWKARNNSVPSNVKAAYGLFGRSRWARTRGGRRATRTCGCTQSSAHLTRVRCARRTGIAWVFSATGACLSPPRTSPFSNSRLVIGPLLRTALQETRAVTQRAAEKEVTRTCSSRHRTSRGIRSFLFSLRARSISRLGKLKIRAMTHLYIYTLLSGRGISFTRWLSM